MVQGQNELKACNLLFVILGMEIPRTIDFSIYSNTIFLLLKKMRLSRVRRRLGQLAEFSQLQKGNSLIKLN